VPRRSKGLSSVYEQRVEKKVMDLNSVQYFQDAEQSSSYQEEEDWSSYLSSPGCTLVAGMLCGIAANLISRYLPNTARNISIPSNPFMGNYKMVLVVRTDLGMQKGKVAAQCAHAALDTYKKSVKVAKETTQAWEATGQAKVCLKTDSQESLLDLAGKARELGIPWSVVRDAGRTQIEAGSMTVLGIGPAEADIIDKVTGHLKLY